jgi:tetratricopeptide (TPR) repeat protein
MNTLAVLRRAATAWLGALALAAGAQTTTPAAAPKARPARAAAEKAAPAAPPVRAGKGWRIGPAPGWVVAPPHAGPETVAAAPRRDLLIDVQVSYVPPKPQSYYRLRTIAAEAAALGFISQPQIRFNPAYQTVVVHDASIVREGRRSDRLADAGIELMRREQQLEHQIIDGSETLLLLLKDVRTGDVVEIAYTVEGENPIHEGRIDNGMQLAGDAPVGLLHYRLLAPAARRLQWKLIAGSGEPEHREAHGVQELRIVRRDVPALQPEQATPPWFKIYPALLVSDYADWADVDAWAQRLFAPSPPDAALAERVAAFRAGGLEGAALVAQVLRFVQDEVRYFSVSLGESSHRPKPAARTLAERVGDCKDKTVLLTALLGALGFDARPALVSMRRGRGIDNYLPGHSEFDHVITRLELDGQTWWLDATMSGQGLTLADRGTYPYGSALVVGGSGGLQPVALPPSARFDLEFEQHWVVSAAGAPARLRAVMRGRGMMAERLRAGLAGNEERMRQLLAGLHTRVLPALKVSGAATVADDRQRNVFELTQSFEQPFWGEYLNGGLNLELAAFELVENLNGPTEPRRRMPWLYDVPRVATSRISVQTPQRFTLRAPAPVEVNDRHFGFVSRAEINGDTLTLERVLTRRRDEVLPDDLQSFREGVLRTRQLLSTRLRIVLFDQQALTPELEKLAREAASKRGARADTLQSLLTRYQATRLLDGKVIEKAAPDSALAARARASRAIASNALGEHARGLEDADAALAIDPKLTDALDARAMALMGLDRDADAMAALQKLLDTPMRATALKWMGVLEIQQGRAAEGQKLLREAVEANNGDARDFALVWLCIAHEAAKPGSGREAVATHLESGEPKTMAQALLRYVAGALDRDGLLKVARAKPEMERLNLAEAYFYAGQRAALQGQRDDARGWFDRVLETGATPYVEFTLARNLQKRLR